MNKVLKTVLISIGLNLLLALVMFIPVFFSDNSDQSTTWLIVIALVGVISVILQLIISIVLLFYEKHRQIGQGMLIIAGLFLLIGLAVCGGI